MLVCLFGQWSAYLHKSRFLEGRQESGLAVRSFTPPIGQTASRFVSMKYHRFSSHLLQAVGLCQTSGCTSVGVITTLNIYLSSGLPFRVANLFANIFNLT